MTMTGFAPAIGFDVVYHGSILLCLSDTLRLAHPPPTLVVFCLQSEDVGLAFLKGPALASDHRGRLLRRHDLSASMTLERDTPPA